MEELAFLKDCPKEGKFMLFPGFVSSLQEELKEYEEISNFNIKDFTFGFDASLANTKFRVYQNKK